MVLKSYWEGRGEGKKFVISMAEGPSITYLLKNNEIVFSAYMGTVKVIVWIPSEAFENVY